MTNYETTPLAQRARKLYETQCLKIAGVVGTGIHAYSLLMNSEHFESIHNEFANSRYITGFLGVAVPFTLPYAVSLYARKKAQKETRKHIENLESQISSYCL